ncbi:hypothetical protein J437_LFUL007438 [Ladona fulva]|uniref:Uncharacterized protein n=1 Tax=Ladona fulva TaxID=123851 RepID=A0A8K0NWV6_LADFU|nr:hypothetical protein J437_LFUL007438 [Ladona fulva]
MVSIAVTEAAKLSYGPYDISFYVSSLQREAGKAKETAAANSLEPSTSSTSVTVSTSIRTTAAAGGPPGFDKVVSKNVTALLGKTAYLNCRVKNLGNKTRRNDLILQSITDTNFLISIALLYSEK